MMRGTTAHRIGVVSGLLLLPVAAVLVMAPALMGLGGWVGGALVLAGALLLTTGVGLVAGPAHAEHLADRRRPTGRPVRRTR